MRYRTSGDGEYRPPRRPLAANQVDIESEELCCVDPAAWTFRNAASRPVPHLLAPYMSQAEYSGALAGVNRAIDEGPKCCVRPVFRIDDALAPFRQKGLEEVHSRGRAAVDASRAFA